MYQALVAIKNVVIDLLRRFGLLQLFQRAPIRCLHSMRPLALRPSTTAAAVLGELKL